MKKKTYIHHTKTRVLFSNSSRIMSSHVSDEECRQLWNFCKAHLVVESPDQVQQILSDYRQYGLKKGRFIGTVCLPLGTYDGIKGWYLYTRKCFNMQLPLLAYAFNPFHEKLARDFSSKTCWKIDAADWDLALVKTQWWYAAWVNINQQLADRLDSDPKNDNHMALVNTDESEIKKALRDCWESPEFAKFKQHEVYDKTAKMRVYTDALKNGYREEIWVPFQKYFHLGQYSPSGDKPASSMAASMGNPILNGLFNMGVNGWTNSAKSTASKKSAKSNTGGSSSTSASNKRKGNAPTLTFKGSSTASKKSRKVNNDSDEEEVHEDDEEEKNAHEEHSNVTSPEGSEDEDETTTSTKKKVTKKVTKPTAKSGGKGKRTVGAAAKKTTAKPKPKPGPSKKIQVVVTEDKEEDEETPTQGQGEDGDNPTNATMETVNGANGVAHPTTVVGIPTRSVNIMNYFLRK
jgi:hypothetical protein